MPPAYLPGKVLVVVRRRKNLVNVILNDPSCHQTSSDQFSNLSTVEASKSVSTHFNGTSADAEFDCDIHDATSFILPSRGLLTPNYLFLNTLVYDRSYVYGRRRTRYCSSFRRFKSYLFIAVCNNIVLF
jgi:hypothetical protein